MNQHPISNREIQVLELISRGLNSALIAQQLFISKYTVDDHTKNMKRKLNARNKAHLVNLGFTNGLLPLHAKAS